ncbi:SigE family RNA polymerase sigma factor [Luedemannella flava]|uniref:SigE family RNA polymerase sigma factor n=1 Tax=Luedemannella flava TaxID=349316 RepID=A0ABN2M4Y9_9ACTN
MSAHDEFIEYATVRAARLRDLAYLMCGDWHQAQDLTQQTLAKLYVSWARILRRENVDAYARRVLLRELLTEKRRLRSTERPVADIPDSAGSGDQADLRLTLVDALRGLPPQRRAVIVLRYWDDHSVETTAEILRLTPSAVKSLTVRALADLRAVLGTDLPITTS